MLDGFPLIDAVIHAYNMDSSNFANRFAKLCDLVYQSVVGTASPGYAPTADRSGELALGARPRRGELRMSNTYVAPALPIVSVPVVSVPVVGGGTFPAHRIYLSPFPTLTRISDTALALPAFERQMPRNQKDFE